LATHLTTEAPRSRSRKLLQWCSNICLVACGAALAICCFVWVEAHLFQALASQQFSLETRASAAAIDAGSRSPDRENLESVGASRPNNESRIGKLVIDRLGISVIVLEGVDDRTLRIAAGHVPETAFPGLSGNVAIAAHRDTFFRPLRNIRNNDKITLETTVGSYQYAVESTRIVSPERIDVLDPTPYPALTLITCYPFYFVGNAPDRFIVRARQISFQADRRNISKEIKKN